MFSRRRVLVGIVASFTLTAAAPSLVAAQNGPPAQSGNDFPGAKSETTAFVWSLLGTAIPIGMGVAMSSEQNDNAAAGLTLLGALVLGPSFGHFYADRPGRALAGIGLRTLALAGVTAGAAATWNNDNDAVAGIAYASLALGGVAVLWDIVRAPHSAQVHNEQRRRSFPVSPTLTPDGAGVRLGARVSF